MPEKQESFFEDFSIPRDGKFHPDPNNPMNRVRWLQPWHPPGVSQTISGGNTARLGLMADGSVYKYPFDKDDRFLKKSLAIEHTILMNLGVHERIVTYLGREEYGLRFARAVNGDVRQYMSAQGPPNVPLQVRKKWVKQVVDALAFVHSKGVIHCDIHPNNFLLDEQLDLQLCDFSGSLYGELDGAAMESTRYFLPRPLESLPNVRTDLFALGSAMYYMLTGNHPYSDLSDEEVVALYSKEVFPDTTQINYGNAILGCWRGTLVTAEDARLSLDRDSSSIDQES